MWSFFLKMSDLMFGQPISSALINCKVRRNFKSLSIRQWGHEGSIDVVPIVLVAQQSISRKSQTENYLSAT